MKFIIKQEILLESLNHTSRAISPRNLIPILTGIKFELNEDGLYLSTSHFKREDYSDDWLRFQRIELVKK